MTERAYRLVVGIGMILFLFFQWNYAIYALLVLLLFEALSNWRVPIIISRLRYHNDAIKVTDGENKNCSINYEAERMLRWIVFILVGIGFLSHTGIDALAYTEQLWFIPWFVGLMLLLAGITGICPMVMMLRWLGLK